MSKENRDVNPEMFKTHRQEVCTFRERRWTSRSHRAGDKHIDFAGTPPFKCHLHFMQTLCRKMELLTGMFPSAAERRSFTLKKCNPGHYLHLSPINKLNTLYQL